MISACRSHECSHVRTQNSMAASTPHAFPLQHAGRQHDRRCPSFYMTAYMHGCHMSLMCMQWHEQSTLCKGESGECGCKLTAFPSLRPDRTTCRCTVAQTISQKTAVSLRPTHPRARCTSLHNTMSATVSKSLCCQCVCLVLLHVRSARDRMATCTSAHAYRFEKMSCQARAAGWCGRDSQGQPSGDRNPGRHGEESVDHQHDCVCTVVAQRAAATSACI
jgi:hypothetical protein